MFMVGIATPSFAHASKKKNSKPVAAATVKNKAAKSTKIANTKSSKKSGVKVAKTKRMSEKERKALAWRQVQHARMIAAKRKAQEEAAQRQISSVVVAERVLPQPAVEITGQDGDVIEISEFDNIEEDM